MFIDLSQWLSPDDERSIFKGIPIGLRNSIEIRNLMMTGLYTVRYRGKSKPGYRRKPNHCLRQYADTFSIYEKNRSVVARSRIERKKYLEELRVKNCPHAVSEITDVHGVDDELIRQEKRCISCDKVIATRKMRLKLVAEEWVDQE